MRWVAVWRHHFLVWRKLVIASVLSNLADPLILLFGLGYGLGALLPSVEGMSYIAFFAAGTLCSATMFTASFESMFSGFSRMHGQKTWDAILYAPHHRRRGGRRDHLGREQGVALGRDDPRGRRCFRPRRLARGGADAAGGVPRRT